MKLGTHNSMSYLPIKKWYLYLFKFIAKCQSKSIQYQYELGARMFDIRVSFNYQEPEFRHGLISYKGDVFNTLQDLNNLGDKVYVRLILELNKFTVDKELKENFFCNFCKYVDNKYRNIEFFCGRRKDTWEQLYVFKTPDIEIAQKIGSMASNKLWSVFPWLYARLFNKKSKSNSDKDEWLLLDFIEIK